MAFFNFFPASTHSNKLERWLGKDNVEQISRSMRGFHGKSIPVANVPGRVFATTDGDFCGPIKGGYLSSLFEYTLHKIHKAVKKVGSGNRLYTGFASLSDLIAEATVGGKKQTLMFAKSGATGVANKANSLWDLGPQPAAGSTSAAPGGSSPDNTTLGGLKQVNPTGGDTLHFVSATAVSTVANNLLLLYDRYFQVNHNMTTDPQSVTGVPTRYQSTASKGSFITAFVTTVLPAATPTYTITYCVDDKTECLCKRLGWTTYENLNENDEILVFNTESCTTKWEKPKSYYINKEYNGDMISHGDIEFSSLTTPNHKWPIEIRNRNDSTERRFTYKDSENLGTDGFILRGAKHDAPKQKKYSDEFVRFVAWYVTEGTLFEGGKQITVCQSHKVNQINVEAIRNDILSMGAIESVKVKRLSFGKRGGRGSVRREGLLYSEKAYASGITRWVISGTEVDKIIECAPGKDKVPTMDFLCSLTDDQLVQFIDISIRADGHKKKNLFTQHHKERMDAYCVAATLAGWGPSLYSNGTGMAIRASQGRGFARTNVGKIKTERVQYSGTVWCPQTEAGNWVARRNGKVFITGNSDQDGNTAETAVAQTIVSGAIARSFPFAATVGNGWFIPLNSGDSGVRKITNLDLSAAMASGFIDVVLCMPYVWIPQGIANFPVIIDGINSAFNLVQIVDNACLSFMEINKGATTATNYSGTITLVAG